MGDEIMRMLENLVLKEARTFEILKKQYEAMLAELPKGSLTVCGCNFDIVAFEGSTITVRGNISSIEFCI